MFLTILPVMMTTTGVEYFRRASLPLKRSAFGLTVATRLRTLNFSGKSQIET